TMSAAPSAARSAKCVIVPLRLRRTRTGNLRFVPYAVRAVWAPPAGGSVASDEQSGPFNRQGRNCTPNFRTLRSPQARRQTGQPRRTAPSLIASRRARLLERRAVGPPVLHFPVHQHAARRTPRARQQVVELGTAQRAGTASFGPWTLYEQGMVIVTRSNLRRQ